MPSHFAVAWIVVQPAGGVSEYPYVFDVNRAAEADADAADAGDALGEGAAGDGSIDAVGGAADGKALGAAGATEADGAAPEHAATSITTPITDSRGARVSIC